MAHICTERGRISDFILHSLMMGEDKSEVTGKILNLTLEIIFLLTGEDFILSRKQKDPSSDAGRLRVSEGRPCQEETPKPGETPGREAQEVLVRCEDVAVFFSPEEWEYMEGHKERYKELITESHQLPDTAAGDVPTIPLTSQERPEEGQTVVTRELQVPPAAETVPPQIKEEDVPVDISSDGDVPTIPLTSQESTEEGQTVVTRELQVPPAAETVPPQIKEEDVPVDISSGGHIPIKPPKSRRKRLMTREHQAPSGKEKLMHRCKEQEIPVEISSGNHSSMTPPEKRGGNITSNTVVKKEDERKPQESQAVTGDKTLPSRCKEEPNPSEILDAPTSWKAQPDFPHALVPVQPKNEDNPSNLEGSISRDLHPIVVIASLRSPQKAKSDQPPHSLGQEPRGDATSSSLMKAEGGDVNDLAVVYICMQCGLDFGNETDLFAHEQMLHCALCKQCFNDKSALVVHQWAFHMPKPITNETKYAAREEGPFSCNECGKLLLSKSSLDRHQSIHTGAFSCPECGKCLTDWSGLIRHRKTHRALRCFPCLDCGRHFTQRKHLMCHLSVHKK